MAVTMQDLPEDLTSLLPRGAGREVANATGLSEQYVSDLAKRPRNNNVKQVEARALLEKKARAHQQELEAMKNTVANQ